MHLFGLTLPEFSPIPSTGRAIPSFARLIPHSAHTSGSNPACIVEYVPGVHAATERCHHSFAAGYPSGRPRRESHVPSRKGPASSAGSPPAFHCVAALVSSGIAGIPLAVPGSRDSTRPRAEPTPDRARDWKLLNQGLAQVALRLSLPDLMSAKRGQ